MFFTKALHVVYKTTGGKAWNPTVSKRRRSLIHFVRIDSALPHSSLFERCRCLNACWINMFER